ncbi:DegT/DnrJ/EryC1/StrS family aminotransferase [Brevibacterium sediminis]|uniref:DegT/DnrJ/EryC1/StrS family aminotransferase n=1 Tax=Brevibacterium sediminis TaxID=1857024 RepID=UPI002174D258|nr:DegT/DnrJ/EryC1/StrS family aminotransferase [Brevibacterium sediminis]MCS4592675.1 DegT/DnrJ/EryC1/StrS family aminotransferase [Brevibacterium sediminis]
MRLAIDGGPPVWTSAWPEWPKAQRNLITDITETLESGRWAVSGQWTGAEPVDLRLGRKFAEYCGAKYGLPVDHGSSALMISLLSTGVRPGDEVILPGLSWVATASAIARIGAIPVLADVEQENLCISSSAVVQAITDRTRAVVVVHLYSTMADMDALEEICQRHNILLIEDCAQAYGARWNDRPAGSIGIAGAFSTQQGKALTSGEGGLFVTSSDEVYKRAEMYRGDGRAYPSDPPAVGYPALSEHDEVQGWNMHLSEIQATILLNGLSNLEEMDNKRRAAASFLDGELRTRLSEFFQPVIPYPQNRVRGYYHYVIKLRQSAWSGIDIEAVCKALSAELGMQSHATYIPLNQNPLLDPQRLWGNHDQWDLSRFELPNSESVRNSSILLHHSVLLADDDALNSIIVALHKIAVCQDRLRECA